MYSNSARNILRKKPILFSELGRVRAKQETFYRRRWERMSNEAADFSEVGWNRELFRPYIYTFCIDIGIFCLSSLNEI